MAPDIGTEEHIYTEVTDPPSSTFQHCTVA